MNSTVTEILKNINIDPIAKIYFVNPIYKSQEDKYKIARLNTNDSVTKAVKDVVKKYMELIKDRKKIPIDKIDKGDEDYVATLPIENVESLKDIIDLIKDEKYSSFHAHNAGEYLAKLKYYVVEFQINKSIYYFLRRYSQYKLMAPRNIFLLFKENTFEHINDKDVFVLENEFDAFIKDEEIFVIKDKQFSYMTGYYKKETEYANKILDEIEKIQIIDNFEELREHCEERISYIKRLSKVDLSIVKKIDFEKIVELKNNRGTDFEVNYERNTISFKNNDQLKNVLDLILDNFMTSDVTGEAYRAINKLRDTIQTSTWFK